VSECVRPVDLRDHERGCPTVSSPSTGLVMDIRGLTPALRRPIVFTVVDKMLDIDCADSVVVICDHEPAGLGYQLELRKETKGQFEFFYDQRLDGAWVALIRRRMV
jgi:uncharacterized protein (DUF2249 family)